MSATDLLDVEAYAHGKPVDLFAPPADCEHRTMGVDCVTGIILDDRGEIASREVRVRVRCAECGAPANVSLDDVRRPKDGEKHGIILVVTPAG